MSFALRQADMPFFNACSYQERAFYEDWQRESGLSTYEMCRILEAQREERDRQAYEDYLEECRDMMRQQEEEAEAEAEAAAAAEAAAEAAQDDADWEVAHLVWKELQGQVQTRLEALVEAHLDETLAVALTEEQLAHYRDTLGPDGLEDVLAEFMRSDEVDTVLAEMFGARAREEEFDVDEKVAGLYQQFAREHVERLSLGYA